MFSIQHGIVKMSKGHSLDDLQKKPQSETTRIDARALKADSLRFFLSQPASDVCAGLMHDP